MHYQEGIITKLMEINVDDAEEIVGLRNNPIFNKFLFQSPISIKQQQNWIESNKLRNDNFNFKIVDTDEKFKGTISIYEIEEKRALFGRYICTNPVHAIEAEYLLLNFGFKHLQLDRIACHTNSRNSHVWKQHLKFGFRTLEVKNIMVGDPPRIPVEAMIQEISAAQYYDFDYSAILKLIQKFKC